MSNEKFKPPYTANKSLSPKLVWISNSRKRLEFKESRLMQEDKEAYTPKNVVIFFVYELDSCPRDLNTDFTLGGCLFGGVKLTKNADPDKYSYSGYGIGFDTRGEYSLSDSSMGKNAIILGFDISSSVHIHNKGKDMLFLGEGPTWRLNYTLTAETQY